MDESLSTFRKSKSKMKAEFVKKISFNIDIVPGALMPCIQDRI